MALIAGVDEVGRGPLAGPVVAAAVVFEGRPKIKGLRDSKKVTEENRLLLCNLIKEKAICWAIGIASVKEIDQINILQASMLAMKRAIEALTVQPDFALIDGNRCPDVILPMEPIIGGDDIVPGISAASIIAKVTRDYLMTLFDKNYPLYGFSQHKGYGTVMHLKALKKHGVTPLHRQSFAPVKALLEA
jgi:ribonuclease HII